MAENEVKVFFKVEGIDGYITSLDDLQTALSKTDTETKDLSKSQEEVNKDIETTTNTIGGMNKKLNDLQKELQETEVGSDAFNKLQGEIDEVSDKLNEAKNGQAGFTDTLGEAPGAVGGVTKSVKGLGTAFKALLANPVVLVITLIVGALTALFKAFTSTKEGAEAFDRVLAGISAAVDVVRDRVLVFASAIGKFFSGDFAGAFDTAKEAVSGIGDEIVAEAQKAAELTGVLQRNTDALRELDVERAEQNALLAENKLRIDDTTLSIEERQKALEEAGASETALLEKELKLENERLAALEALAEQSDSDAETLDEIAQQRIRIANLEQQSLQKQTELLGKAKALRAEEAAAEKALADERERKRKEAEEAAQKQLENELAISEELRRKKLDDQKLELDDLRLKYEEQVKLAGKNTELLKQLDDQYIADKKAVNDKFDKEEQERVKTQQQTINDILNQYADEQFATEEERELLEAEKQFEADKLALEKAITDKELLNQKLLELDKLYEDKVTDITKKGEDNRQKIRKETVKQTAQLVANLFDGFASLNNARTADDEAQAKKQFNLNKAFSISSALINTGLAVTDVLAQEKTGLIGKILAAAAIGAQGLAQVISIKNTQFEGGSEGDIGTVEQPTFNPQAAIDLRNQQLGDLQDSGEEVIPGQTAEPVQAYVIATEVSSAQEANNQIENLSKL